MVLVMGAFCKNKVLCRLSWQTINCCLPYSSGSKKFLFLFLIVLVALFCSLSLPFLVDDVHMRPSCCTFWSQKICHLYIGSFCIIFLKSEYNFHSFCRLIIRLQIDYSMSRRRNIIVATGLIVFASAGLAFPFYMA